MEFIFSATMVFGILEKAVQFAMEILVILVCVNYLKQNWHR